MAKLVSKTYGKALFDLAMEEGTLDLTAKEAEVVLEVIAENPELSKLLNHPKLVKEEKITIVENAFKTFLSDTFLGFLTLVVQKDRYNEIRQILQYFLDLVREEKKIGVAKITSAVSLSDAQKQQICSKLLETTDYVSFEMHYEVDASLIGGLVIRVGDKVVDSSIRNRINNMAKSLSRIQLS